MERHFLCLFLGRMKVLCLLFLSGRWCRRKVWAGGIAGRVSTARGGVVDRGCEGQGTRCALSEEQSGHISSDTTQSSDDETVLANLLNTSNEAGKEDLPGLTVHDKSVQSIQNTTHRHIQVHGPIFGKPLQDILVRLHLAAMMID